ncbi:spore germination protein [Sporolactobacillus inulinus]|uniref:spore germination protein n=1 Tax=Sporolactobacillus inulinus TaxID=2078 RepID=UPI0035A22CF3
MPKKQARQVADTEVETSIVGAHDSFVESLETNINLVRSRIPIPQFKVEEQRIGKLSRTRISILYIEGLANKANLNTTRQRITDLETVSVINANMLALMIGDNSQSFFLNSSILSVPTVSAAPFTRENCRARGWFSECTDSTKYNC